MKLANIKMNKVKYHVRFVLQVLIRQKKERYLVHLLLLESMRMHLVVLLLVQLVNIKTNKGKLHANYVPLDIIMIKKDKFRVIHYVKLENIL